MKIINIVFVCALFVLICPLPAHGQTTDTLYHYQSEYLEDGEWAILDYVLDFGIYYENPFPSCDIIGIEFLFLSVVSDYYDFPVEFEFSVNAAVDDSAPGPSLYHMNIVLDDTLGLYPHWQYYDLMPVDSLKNITSDFWISGYDLRNTLWDTTEPISNKVRVNLDNTYWATEPIDMGVRVIVQQNDTDISPESTVPEQTVLLQNYPNPFNGFTTIRLHFPHQTVATLRIFDAAGRLVNVLHESIRVPAGGYTTQWAGLDQTGMPVSSGLYFLNVRYTQDGSSRSLNKKIVVVQ